jgi:hypothetical protein
MKNDVKKVLLTCVLFIGVMSLSAQLSQHGLVVNGGIGRVDAKSNKWGARWDEIDYKVGLSLGYRLQYNKPEPKSFHYDWDINVGVKGARVGNWSKPESTDGKGYISVGYGGVSGGAAFHYTSIGFTANYSLIKNLSAGLGVKPAYFFKADEIKNSFDIPVVAKIAYNLKVVEIGICGKYGLLNVFEMDYLKSGKIRDLQLSIFIPFKTK